MADVPPPNYNPTPLTPSAGGVIHAMHGGGDGGAPPHYNPHSLLPEVHQGIPIKAYEGGGLNDPAVIAVSAVATKEANNVTSDAITAITAITANTTATTTTVVAEKVSNVPTDVPSKKQISLNGLTLTIGPPWDLKGVKETEALAWFGVDKASDDELKREVLQALYDGVCDTNKPLIMVLECEPIRRLVQSLAEKLLGNLTRPVVKKTPAVIAVQEQQSAKLMTFNVFKNQCKTKTAKEYIDSSDADIVCTQKDTKMELANYTEIKACGADDDTERVYLKKGLSSATTVECITVDKHSAVLFIYQGVTLVNIGSADEKLLEEVLKREPHIILGSVADVSTKGYIHADPSNKDLITADAIWYKKDQNVFELKDTIIPDIVVKTDHYTDPVSCSYSDHNPITVVIHFKKTIKKISSNADRAAEAAAKAATEATAVGSRAMEALEGIQSKSIDVEVSDGTQSKSDDEESYDMDTLEQRISFFEAEPTEIERTRIEKILTKDGSDQSLKDQRNAYGSFFTRSTPTSAHTQYKTKNTHNMLEFVKAHLYDRTNGVIERLPNHYKQFKADLTRANHLTFVSDTFKRTGNEGITQEDYNQIFPIIEKLPNPLGQIVSCFHQFMTETPIGIGMNDNDPLLVKISEYPTLFMILPDKIIFHKVCVYQQNMTMNDPIDMKPSQFATEFTIEIDRATLNGSIQIDKYDIKSYVKEFEEAHTKNFEIASINSQNRTFETMMLRIYARISRRLNPITTTRDPHTGKPIKNAYFNSIYKNAQSGQQHDIDVIRDTINMFELDNGMKDTQLTTLDNIKEDVSKVGSFMSAYNVKLQYRANKPYSIPSINEEWYNTTIISPPEVIRMLDTSSYEKSIQDSIVELKEQPELHKHMYEQIMIELKKRQLYYEADYRAKYESNKKENDSLSVLLSDDKLSELLERIKEFRMTDAASWLPSISGIFRRRSITGKIDERIKFHEHVRQQTIDVFQANVACAKASEHYTLFQNLVNEIGVYLSRKNLVEYAPKEIVASHCDILDSDRIAPAIQPVEEAIVKIENGVKMSPIELQKIELEVKAAVEEVGAAAMESAPVEAEEKEIAANSIFDDEMAKRIAIAAVSVIMNDFVKTANKKHTIPIQVPALNDFVEHTENQQQEEQLSHNKSESPPSSSIESQNNNVHPSPLLSSNKGNDSMAPSSSIIKPVSSSASYQPEFDDFLSQLNNDISPIKPLSKNGSTVPISPVLPSSPTKTYNPRRKYVNEIPQYSEILEKSLPEYKPILGNDPTIQRTLTILDRIDTLRDKTYNDKIRNQDILSAIRRELNDHSKDLRSKLLAYVTTPSTKKNTNGKKIGRNSVSSILTKTMNNLVNQLPDLDNTLSELKEVTIEDDPVFKEINRASRGLPSSSIAPQSSSVIASSSNSNRNKVLNTTKKIITNTMTGITGKANNLTENFKKRNALTSELKQKKFKGLNQQLKNEGVNFRGSPAKNETSVAVPVAIPVAVPKPTNIPAAKKPPTYNELNTELLKSLQKRPSKHAPPSEEDKIKIQMKTLIKVVDAKKTQIRFQLQYMNHENDGNRITEREIEAHMKIIDQRMKQLNDLMENPKIHYETIQQYQNECYDIIGKINELIKRIQSKEGGKRRTQKKQKQKKRFGTQKK